LEYDHLERMGTPLLQQRRHLRRVDIRHFLERRRQHRNRTATRHQFAEMLTGPGFEDGYYLGLHGLMVTQPPINPAVTLMAKPKMDALKKNDTSVCTMTTLRTA
jgi:hypothetical protein